MALVWIVLTVCVSFIDASTLCPSPRSYEVLSAWTWSSWGACSYTCGGGIKTRKPTCRYRWNDRLWHEITKISTVADFAPCNEVCFNGNFYDKKCHCLPGIKGRCCEVVPVCQPACENDGACIAENTCKCREGFYGQWCEIGSDFDQKLKPRLHTTLPLSYTNQLMSWYDTSDTSDYNRACYIKLHFKNAASDTLVSAESRLASDGNQLFGTFSTGPINAKGQLNDTSRFSCLQVKCPGSDLHGTRIDVSVNVSVTSRYKTCEVKNYAINLPDFSLDGAKRSFEIKLKKGENYGSTFGIYFGMGFRDMANHIARQSCLSGRRFDLIQLKPLDNTLADFVCT